MKTEIFDVPVYALYYIEYGDSTGLNQDDINNIDNWMKENNIVDVYPRYEGEYLADYFTYYPIFGKGTNVVECTCVIRE